MSGNVQSRCEACGQPLPKSDEWKERRFRWGMLLAVLTFLPFGIALEQAFRTISAARATGLGAVAGDFTELFVMFGVAAMALCSVTGIVLLVRGFSRGRPVRILGSILGIAWCGFVLIVTTLTVVLLIRLNVAIQR
jgi:ABC-type transport system involved in cytochrome c biogenesis permease subunit